MEPLGIANRISRRPWYGWQIVTDDGEPVAASNGLRRDADVSIAEARDLLETTLVKIIELALTTGFKSAGHFSNRYLSSYGITPGEARARSILSAATRK